MTPDGEVVWSDRTPTPARRGAPYSAVDVEALWDWSLNALAAAASQAEVTDIVPVAHGAAAALVGTNGSLVTPVVDYEHDVRSAVPGYEEERPDFAEIGSPSLPLGLNLGRQLAFLDETVPGARGTTIVPYPQFWALRLSGVAASEASSLGCHSDLWRPREGTWSSLAKARGWDERFAPMRQAGTVLGTVTADVAERTGLPGSCRVRCGVHDSNAALLPYLNEDVTVLSTGTWFVAMAPGAAGDGLDPERDCLVGVDVYGRPVPTARFMGGREHAMVAGDAPEATLRDVLAAAESGLLMRPSLTGSGPHPGRHASCNLLEDPCLRAGVATLYVAMMAAESLSLLGPHARLVVEGPAATDAFCGGLASLLPDTAVARTEAAGPTLGAMRLALPSLPAPGLEEIEPSDDASLLRGAYTRWRERL